MTAKNLQEMFEATYLKPAYRGKIGQYSIYVGDGWVPPDQLESFNRKFGPVINLDESEWATFCMVEVAKGKYSVYALTFDSKSAPAISDRIQMAIDYATQELKKRKALH